MHPSETAFQSFVIKVWLEEGDADSPVWCGRITHIPSHEQRYVKHLDEVVDFIAQHLESAGVKPPLRRRVRRWLFSRAR
jgi:hypothetical protein